MIISNNTYPKKSNSQDVLLGNDGDDDIKGGGRGDQLFGGKGEFQSKVPGDWIYHLIDASFTFTTGGTGSDTLAGGKGGDTLKGGQGSDIVNVCVDDVILGSSSDINIVCKALLVPPPSPPSPPSLQSDSCDGLCGGEAGSCFCDFMYVHVSRCGRESEEKRALALLSSSLFLLAFCHYVSLLLSNIEPRCQPSLKCSERCVHINSYPVLTSHIRMPTCT